LFSGAGTGTGYFDFVRDNGKVRLVHITYELVATPEPASVGLLAAGAIISIFAARKKQASS
jgi:hypothetical protein